ncbi:MAG: sulfatase-like hydrolase/transferase, partial [Acidobacteria bacterium]|nr:sulfatase-like hydrolase/transferase [Acidobacteriota bacterium]
MLKRRNFFQTLTGGLMAATVKPSPLRPNIILCMADDMGWGDPGFNGNRIIRTPNLDALAGNGVRFARFYASSPVCSPTRGSCLTGRHPFRYGIYFANEGHMKAQEITIAEALKTQGYTTGHFGKWHLGTLSKTGMAKPGRKDPSAHYSTPGMNGFDEWFSTEYAVRLWDPGVRNALTERFDGTPVPFLASQYYHNGNPVTDNLSGDDSRVLMDRALPFIENAAARKTPFLAVIWFHAPHEPIMAGPEYRKLYSSYSEGEQHYYGVLTAMDQQVGRLRRSLRRLGVAGNTMLWFCSDNGPDGMTGQDGKFRGSAGPFRGRKRSLFEGGIRVPAALEWPARVKPGSVTDMACSTEDYYPTVLDYLGFQMPGQPLPIDGMSLRPLLEGRISQRPKPIGFETAEDGGLAARHGSPKLALIDGRYKLLSDLDG